jgi:hypothetical protein
MIFIYYMHEFERDSTSDPFRADSLAQVKREFADWIGFNEEAYCDVYVTPPDGWAEAERFCGVGVPFDGIDYRLRVGPRGGLRTEKG